MTANWAQVENQYQRRADLIPNLVETVKAYAAHERETLTAVVEARTKVGRVTVPKDILTSEGAFRAFEQKRGDKIRLAAYNYGALRVAARRDQRPEGALRVTFAVATARSSGSGGTTMANEKLIDDAGAYRSAQPIVRTIGTVDLRDALARGLADFNAMPTHLVFLCVIYPVVMLIIARTYAGYEVLPLVFPLLAGYTLIGPLVATGIYELSRRREQGLDISRGHAFDVLRSPSIRAIATLGVALMAIYFAWLGAALAIYELTFGGAVPASIAEFARQVFTTPSGRALIIVGCGVGFLFAVVVFTLSVVSFPLLLDRDVGAVTAVQTSVRAVLANPLTMAMWGLIVAGTLLIGSLPFFVGLAVVLPVLGHSTWHLYRKVVEWTPNFRQLG